MLEGGGVGTEDNLETGNFLNYLTYKNACVSRKSWICYKIFQEIAKIIVCVDIR